MNRTYAPRDTSMQDIARAEQVIAAQAPERQDVARWLYARAGDGNSFLASLHDQLDRRGTLSPRQWECAADNMARSMTRRAEGSAARPAPADLPDVPEGHYAVPSRTGNNDLDFWRVDRPQTGSYAGRTFVKRIIGGRPDQNVRRDEVRAALEAIVAAGIEEAGTRYGQEIGQCRVCNRHLSDEESRRLGIGPDCRAARA
jgi:hypothetical protein